MKRTIKLLVPCFFMILSASWVVAAQLPNGDNGDHKDKAAYKTDISTETMEIQDYGRIKIKREKTTESGEKSLEFYDAQNRLVKQLKLRAWDYPRVSEDKKLVGIQKYDIGSQDLVILNEKGETVREVKNVRPYGAIYVSNTGAFIAAGSRHTQSVPISGGLAFYNEKAELVKDIKFKRFNTGAGLFFYESEYFVFLFEIPKEGVILRCYNKVGDSFWNYSFGKMFGFDPVDSMFIEKGKVIVKLSLKSGKYTWIFNEKGFVTKKEGW